MVTLRGVGLPEEVVIVPVLHEAPELLVNPGLLRIGHGEVLVLAHDPVPEAAVLHHLVLGPLHALAVELETKVHTKVRNHGEGPY